APKSKLVLSAAERRKVVIDGLLVMILPIFIVAGSVGGVFTPTEAGGVAVLMTLIIGSVIFKTLGSKEIWESLIATGRISASIYLILGASEVLSYVMTLGGMEDWMKHLALDVISDPIIFLLATAAFVLLVGTF